MADDDRSFFDVNLAVDDENACSPKVPDQPSWRGVLIRAPSRVPFRRGAPRDDHGAFTTFPICGYYFVDVAPDPAKRGVVLTAVDRAHGKTYSGEITSLDDTPVVPPPRSSPVPKSQLKGLAVGRHFNANLLWFKGQVSNEVTVELYEPPPEH
jgi:hypothetical protein